jgi:hypothetical protein
LAAPIAAPALRVVRGVAPPALGIPSVDQHLDFRVGDELLPKILIEVVVTPRHDEQPVRHAPEPPSVPRWLRASGRKVGS